jgi:hypothetical protein
MRPIGMLMACLALLTGEAHGAPPPVFSAAHLRADLAEISRALRDMPADLAHSVDAGDLERALAGIDSRLEKSPSLTRDEAWRLFATLNPLLADGHLFVGFPDWRGDVRAHLAAGGSLFPLEVDVTADCALSVHQDPRSSFLPPHAYAAIRSINGVSADEVCEQMMARVHGDTRVFRADLLSRRFWFFHWKVFGAPGSYSISFHPNVRMSFRGGSSTLAGRTRLPDMLEAEEDFRRQFGVHTIADGPSTNTASTAVLRLGTFAWPDKHEVLAFTRQSFEGFQRWKIKTLVIDLRDNGGGNDDQWIEGVMPYLATKRWQTASRFRKRVVTPDAARGEKAGDVVDGTMETWFEPQPDNPLRFEGPVYLLVGPGTYSSAVVMATVFQDFGFGKVIGSGDSVRANQSGGTRRTTLTNSGLVVVSPRFVLTRPSGAKSPELLTPDLTESEARAIARF